MFHIHHLVRKECQILIYLHCERELRPCSVILMVVISFSKFEDHAETLADHDNDSELCMKSTDLGGFFGSNC